MEYTLLFIKDTSNTVIVRHYIVIILLEIIIFLKNIIYLHYVYNKQPPKMLYILIMHNQNFIVFGIFMYFFVVNISICSHRQTNTELPDILILF